MALAMTAMALAAVASPQAAGGATCRLETPRYHFLQLPTGPMRQGATIAIDPRRRLPNPGEPSEHDPCAKDWRSSDPDAVRIAPDGRSIAIAPDAKPGKIVTIRYVTNAFEGNGGVVEARIRIVGRDAPVLIGTYAQSALEDCQGETVRELEFDAEGQFSVTYTPFETYRDFWGDYRFDPATGALTLTVTGGNTKPGFDEIRGTARFDDEGRLHVEELNLGRVMPMTPPDGQRLIDAKCRYTFG